MNLNGSYQFQASSQKLYDALLDPATLQATIPGCEAVWHSTHDDSLRARLTLPLPIHGLNGPYDVGIAIKDPEPPNKFTLHVGRTGRIGGTVDTNTLVTLANNDKGTLMSYDSQIDLKGPIAVVSSPIFSEIIKHSIQTFLKNLDAATAPDSKK